MPISFICPHCKVKMTVPDKFAGVKTKCPSCSEPIIIADLPQSPAQPVNQKPAEPQPRESREWYDRMTGSDDSAKSSLDKMHRDTNVDLSEFVTRWTGDEDGTDEPETETRTRASRSSASPPRPMRSQAPQPRSRESAPAPSGNKALLAGSVVVVLIVVVVLMFAFKKPPQNDENNSTASTTATESGAPVASSQPGPVVSGETPVATPTATVEATEQKTASPEEQAKKDLAYANDSFGRFEFADAIRLYKKYLEFDPKNDEVWLRLIDCHVRMKNRVDALGAVEEAIKNLGESYKILTIKVNLELELDRIPDGVATYDRILKVVPADEKESLLLEVFQLLLMQGEEKKSKDFLDKAWQYLQLLKQYLSTEDMTFYTETLKEAYGNAGISAPF